MDTRNSTARTCVRPIRPGPRLRSRTHVPKHAEQPSSFSPAPRPAHRRRLRDTRGGRAGHGRVARRARPSHGGARRRRSAPAPPGTVAGKRGAPPRSRPSSGAAVPGHAALHRSAYAIRAGLWCRRFFGTLRHDAPHGPQAHQGTRKAAPEDGLSNDKPAATYSPRPEGPSTIGAVGLNCSVRNGKRCFPHAITTGNCRDRPVSTDLENRTQPPVGTGIKKRTVKPSDH